MGKTYKCTVCGKNLSYKAEKCGDCSKKSLQKLFVDNPDVMQAFKEAVEEMKKPENTEKMVKDTCEIIQSVQNFTRKSP